MDYIEKFLKQLEDIQSRIADSNSMLREVKSVLENRGSMDYEVKPVKEICYADGRSYEDFEMSFENTNDETADVFSVYEKDSDGDLRWIADFGKKDEAERRVQVFRETVRGL